MPVEKLKINGKEIVLVGTAHIGKKSVETVRQTIELEKPDCVAVELDRQRFIQLKSGEKWLETDLSRVVKEGKTYLFLINILLASMQKKLGKELGMEPGTEMLEAINLTESNKITVSLVDRDIRVTLKRALNEMGLVEKAKLLFEIVISSFQKHEALDEKTIEKLKDKDTLNALLAELSEKMPSVKRVLVDERDMFIANRIMKSPGKKILAVVGAGHLEGIKKYLGKELDVSKISKVQKKKSIMRFAKYVIPILVIAFLGYGLYSKGFEATLDIFILWFLINGVLSALGALIARAHPFSIVTAFLAAPFTSLHPAFAAGWFAAAMEMKMRCPKVKDFQELKKLESYGDFSRNRVTHVLLVAAYSNLGSTIGTLIALPFILSLLG
ncbi:MAG: TraB/GumN family protein [archaeon]|jgi:pheromone shutdown-related protein TraB|nr:TraB/GumN family protein [archaeon]